MSFTATSPIIDETAVTSLYRLEGKHLARSGLHCDASLHCQTSDQWRWL